MTDISPDGLYIAGRFGIAARVTEDEGLALDLIPSPHVLQHGVVRLSVLSFLVDAVAGIVVDTDPEAWALTSDMSVRMRAVPAPKRIGAVGTILRRGRRSSTSKVELTDDQGEPVAAGAIGFTVLPRRESDPPKPNVTPGHAQKIFRGVGSLERPLREQAEIERVDPANGVVEVLVTQQLRNPAGTMQGAMVALVAEAAAEDLVSARFGVPAVVTDLDLRYLAPAQVGPIRTRARLLGTGPTDPIEVELIDTSVDRVTTHVFARAVPAPSAERG